MRARASATMRMSMPSVSRSTWAMIDWPTSSLHLGRCDSPSTIWVTPISVATATTVGATWPSRRSTVAPRSAANPAARSTVAAASGGSGSASEETWSRYRRPSTRRAIRDARRTRPSEFGRPSMQTSTRSATLGRWPSPPRAAPASCCSATSQRAGWQVDQHQRVGPPQQAVGERLAHPHAGQLEDLVVEALEVLDVDGGEDVDVGIQQLLDVLPALGVAAAGVVGVGQLVDQAELRLAVQQPVDVHLGEGSAADSGHPAGGHLQPGGPVLGGAAQVGLQVADHHVHPGGLQVAGLTEHGVGLSHPGGRAEEDLEPAALGAARHLLAVHHRSSSRPSDQVTEAADQRSRSSARFSASTLTRGSPKMPSVRPWVCWSTSRATAAGSSPRALATRLTWKSAAAGEMSGSSPDPEAVTSSDGTCAAVVPGLDLSSASSRSLTSWSSLAEVGPRLEAPDARGS